MIGIFEQEKQFSYAYQRVHTHTKITVSIKDTFHCYCMLYTSIGYFLHPTQPHIFFTFSRSVALSLSTRFLSIFIYKFNTCYYRCIKSGCTAFATSPTFPLVFHLVPLGTHNTFHKIHVHIGRMGHVKHVYFGFHSVGSDFSSVYVTVCVCV